MSESRQQQKKKKSSSVAAAEDAKTTDRRPLVSTRTSPLIRVMFRNPAQTSVSGGDGGSTTGGGSSTASAQGGGVEGCDSRRRRSVDSASLSGERAADQSGTAMTTDDLSLEPRTRQYQKNDLLQERLPESGLTELETFLLEKQRLMELASSDDQKNNDDDGDDSADKLVPRAPHYVPHPILQVKTETGLTELELYFKQKEAQMEQGTASEVDKQPAADAASS